MINFIKLARDFWRRAVAKENEPPKTPLNRDAFAAAVMALIKERGETRELVYEANEFRICLVAKRGNLVNLHNVYQEYLAVDPEGRENALRRTAMGWRMVEDEIELTYESVAPDLFPAIRARAYFELLYLESQIQGAAPSEVACREFAEHLCLALVHDEPHTMRFLAKGEVDAWGRTWFELLETATQNLSERPMSYGRIGNYYELLMGDGYNASRLLQVERLRELEVTGELIAMVPSRDCLILGFFRNFNG